MGFDRVFACAVASLSADNGASFVILNDMTVSGGSVVTVAGSTTVNANITPKTVNLSASKVYDGSTSLSGKVTLATGVGSEV